jgi:hypothetical protein
MDGDHVRLRLRSKESRRQLTPRTSICSSRW